MLRRAFPSPGNRSVVLWPCMVRCTATGHDRLARPTCSAWSWGCGYPMSNAFGRVLNVRFPRSTNQGPPVNTCASVGSACVRHKPRPIDSIAWIQGLLGRCHDPTLIIEATEFPHLSLVVAAEFTRIRRLQSAAHQVIDKLERTGQRETMSDETRSVRAVMLALAEEHGISMPTEAALDVLRVQLKLLRGSDKWKKRADIVRQSVERYLEEVDLPMELAPVVASILAGEGEPWALVRARIIVSEGGAKRESRTRHEEAGPDV